MTGEDDDEDRDLRAAGHVLGTLRGVERTAFAAALSGDADLRRRVAAWERRLLGLALTVAPVAPPPGLWARIDAALGPPARAPVPLFRRRSFQGAALLAAAAVILLALLRPVPAPPALVAVLAPAAAGAQPAFAVQTAPGQAALVTPVGAGTPPAGHGYELWLVRAPAPLALGMIAPGGRLRIPPDRLPGGRLERGQTLAVSLEQPGGAPDGVPAGPVVFTGTLVPLAPDGDR